MFFDRFFVCVFLLGAILILSCGKGPQKASDEVLSIDWDTLVEQARGQEVHMMMWQGDPLINDYMQAFVRPRLKEQFDIELTLVSGQGNVIVQTLLKEMEAGLSESELDLLWINGETFYQLRQIDALFGPWTDQLPNMAFVRLEDPFINTDFQQPIAGYECPWGNVQMALIYNRAKVDEPPRTRAELESFVRSHPGKFTFDTHFTGLTFLKSLLIDLAGGPGSLQGPFDEVRYQQYSEALWSYIRRIRPFLWKGGKTFPEAVAPLHQLFASGEVWFTMSNNDNEVDNKVLQGLFPDAARAYVPEFGSIRNTHYLGIPVLSGKKAAAMVIANFLISPEAQYQKQDPSVWGDGTVLEPDRLPEVWRERFRGLPSRKYAPTSDSMRTKALQELAPEYMIRLAGDFREKILYE